MSKLETIKTLVSSKHITLDLMPELMDFGEPPKHEFYSKFSIDLHDPKEAINRFRSTKSILDTRSAQEFLSQRRLFFHELQPERYPLHIHIAIQITSLWADPNVSWRFNNPPTTAEQLIKELRDAKGGMHVYYLTTPEHFIPAVAITKEVDEDTVELGRLLVRPKTAQMTYNDEKLSKGFVAEILARTFQKKYKKIIGKTAKTSGSERIIALLKYFNFDYIKADVKDKVLYVLQSRRDKIFDETIFNSLPKGSIIPVPLYLLLFNDIRHSSKESQIGVRIYKDPETDNTISEVVEYIPDCKVMTFNLTREKYEARNRRLSPN